MANSRLLIVLFCSAVYGKSLTGDNICEKERSYGSICTVDMKPGFCFENKCVLAMSPTSQRLLIKIRYPLNNKYARNTPMDGTKMFVRGNGLGLSWTEGKPMRKSHENDTWEYQLNFGIPGLDLPSNKKPVARFEFRVYFNTKNMLGPNFVIPLPLSTNTKNVSKIPVFVSYPWFFHKEGTLKKRSIFSPQLGHDRMVDVYLPPSFQENTYKQYETLIVNDGQRLEFMLPQLDILMVTRALIKEVLVIGIHNDFENRTRLLAVSNGSEISCINGGQMNHCNQCLRCNSSTCSYEKLVDDYQRCYKWVTIPKVYGQLYLDFIQDTVIPECKSKYRALPGANNFGIMGFSLGGLMSCHAIWTRPKTFGSAACMSPSLWWPFPENASFPEDAGYEFTRSTIWKHRGARPRQKIYIDVGGEEGYLMVEPSKNASKILASSPYFEMNVNLWFYIWNGEHHTFINSVHRMWIPLIAFYGAEGSPQAEIVNLVANETNRAGQNNFEFMSLFLVCLSAHITLKIL